MIEKHLRQFSSIEGLPGVRSVQLIRDVDSLIKSASNFSYEFSPEFLENIDVAKKRMYPNEILIATISVGDGEIYGPNVNGDYFTTETLDRIYKTFETGHTFVEHNNSDVNKSVGRILYAFRNRKMRRIELLNTAERGKADSWIRKIDLGEPVDVSFGYKTPWDECSICHNKARRRSEYCRHLAFQMNQILPSGEKVYAINPDIGRFFEISFVSKGAVPIARMMKKVARQNGGTSVFVGHSAVESPIVESKEDTVEKIAEELTYTKSAGVKLAEMIKNIESNLAHSGVSPDILKEISATSFPFSMAYEKPINASIFKGHGLGTVMANMGEAAIVPSMEEFASILSVLSLRISDLEKAVSQLRDGKVSYDEDNCRSDFLNIIPSDTLRHKMFNSGLIENRSWHGPRVIKRIILMASSPRGLEKQSRSVLIPAIVTSAAAGKLYAEYLKRVAPSELSMLEKSIKKNPRIAMALLFGSIVLPHIFSKPVNYEYKRTGGTMPLNKLSSVESMIKESGFVKNVVLPFAGANLVSAHLYNQKQQGKDLGVVQNFIAEHPFYTTAAAVGGLYGGKKMLQGFLKKKASVPYKDATECAVGIMMGADTSGIFEDKNSEIKISI